MNKILVLIILAFSLCAESAELSKEELLEKYQNLKPKQWGSNLVGVIKKFHTEEKKIALTLDLCGGKNDNLDERIVKFLEDNQIKATFFVSARWITKFPRNFERLHKNPLFEIENHGFLHRPASLKGRTIYGIKGTKNAQELFDEVAKNADLIEKITGTRPKFFRSGTAYYDEFAIALINDMGFKVVGFSVLGDGGTSFKANKVKNTFLKAKGGDILIAHANKPKKASGEGVVLGIKALLQLGFNFVRLDEVLD